MKKIIATSLLLLMAVPSFCQDIEVDGLTQAGLVFIDSFYGNEYSIRAMEEDGTDTFHVLLGLSNDRNGNINLRYFHVFPKDYSQFYSCLCQVRDKFTEWAKTASENGVKNFNKQIPVDFGNTVYKYSSLGPGKNYSIDFVTTFSVDEEGQSSLRLGAKGDEYDCYIYESPEEFSALVDKVGLDNIREKYEVYLQWKKAEADRDSLFE